MDAISLNAARTELRAVMPEGRECAYCGPPVSQSLATVLRSQRRREEWPGAERVGERGYGVS
jgi:hypothetical protein